MSVLLEHCRLNEREHAYLYQLIVGDMFIDSVSSSMPRVVLLGGQPGSGKTKMRELAMNELPSVVINADNLRDYHPMYERLRQAEPEKASFLVNEDVSLWTQKLIQQAVKEKRNIVFDGTFGSSDQKMITETLTRFKGNGYETKLWVLAVPAELSKLGIYLRNEMQIMQTGSGRFVSVKVHDLNYKNIPANIEMTVKNSLVDQVCIFSRTVEKVNNMVTLVHSLNKADAGFKNVADIFLQTRNQPLPATMKNYCSIRLNEVVTMIDKRLEKALKTNEMGKVESISDYKNQFLTIFGMSRNEPKTINIEL